MQAGTSFYVRYGATGCGFAAAGHRARWARSLGFPPASAVVGCTMLVLAGESARFKGSHQVCMQQGLWQAMGCTGSLAPCLAVVAAGARTLVGVSAPTSGALGRSGSNKLSAGSVPFPFPARDACMQAGKV